MKQPPVGIWMLNEANQATDLSGSGNHGTPFGITLTTGPMGEANTAFRYAGTSKSYVIINGSTSMDVGKYGLFTFVSFIKTQKGSAPFLKFEKGVHVLITV